jgi:hypothetical protein
VPAKRAAEPIVPAPGRRQGRRCDGHRPLWLARPFAQRLFLDFDNDGDQDLVVALNAHIAIGVNDRTGNFASWVQLEGSDEEEIFSLSAADPDLDGDLDLYACRYVAAGLMGGVPTPYYDANGGAPNFYWRNEGNGSFTNATEEVGLNFNNNKYSLASIWEDFDRDGDPDLYVTNDFGRNTYYRNDRGYFREIATEIGADDMAASMGVTCADVDLDGDVDIYVSNMFSPEGLRVTGEAPFLARQAPELAANSAHARGNTLLLARGDGTLDFRAFGYQCGRLVVGRDVRRLPERRARGPLRPERLHHDQEREARRVELLLARGPVALPADGRGSRGLLERVARHRAHDDAAGLSVGGERTQHLLPRHGRGEVRGRLLGERRGSARRRARRSGRRLGRGREARSDG